MAAESTGTGPTARRIAEIYAEESRAVLATLIRLLGDFDRAEEALQDAFTAALEAWPRTGVPRNPRAWLVSTGRFKGIEALRRRRRGDELAIEAARDAPPQDEDVWDGDVVHDDQLRLIFTCCHPVLAIDARIALSLRDVCGLTTEEIAQAYLVSAGAMKRRLSRAKATIREKRIPYAIPPLRQLASRLDAVLHVIYLVYNEGYAASSGDRHIRRELTREALFLARLVTDLIPEPEALGLLALLLLHESRSDARIDDQGDPVSLEDQDRSLWDRELIAAGMRCLQQTITTGRMGPYAIQAAIASVHADAASVETTNWSLIVSYYDALLAMQSSPVVALQRAIALGMRDGARAGLEIIDELIDGGALPEYHPAHAARAELARRCGAFDVATAAYRRALELTRQEPERRYLRRRLAEITR